MTFTSAEAAAHDLASRLDHVKGGGLRVFGDWFGKPYDNFHRARSAVAIGDLLRITFDEFERLDVMSPRRWAFDESTFEIGGADRVTWGWFAYGRSRTPENWFTIDHQVSVDRRILVISDVDWCRPKFDPSLGLPAVELLSGFEN